MPAWHFVLASYRIICMHFACCIAVYLPVCLPFFPAEEEPEGGQHFLFLCIMSTIPHSQYTFVNLPQG